MEVLVCSVNQVHEVAEASGHVVGGETEPSTARQGGLLRNYRSSSTDGGDLSRVEDERLGLVTSEDEHLCGAELYTGGRHRLDEIRVVNFELLPLLSGDDVTVSS